MSLFFLHRRSQAPRTEETVVEFTLQPVGEEQIEIRMEEKDPQVPHPHSHGAAAPSPRYSCRHCARRYRLLNFLLGVSSFGALEVGWIWMIANYFHRTRDEHGLAGEGDCKPVAADVAHANLNLTLELLGGMVSEHNADIDYMLLAKILGLPPMQGFDSIQHL